MATSHKFWRGFGLAMFAFFVLMLATPTTAFAQDGPAHMWGPELEEGQQIEAASAQEDAPVVKEVDLQQCVGGNVEMSVVTNEDGSWDDVPVSAGPLYIFKGSPNRLEALKSGGQIEFLSEQRYDPYSEWGGVVGRALVEFEWSGGLWVIENENHPNIIANYSPENKAMATTVYNYPQYYGGGFKIADHSNATHPGTGTVRDLTVNVYNTSNVTPTLVSTQTLKIPSPTEDVLHYTVDFAPYAQTIEVVGWDSRFEMGCMVEAPTNACTNVTRIDGHDFWTEIHEDGAEATVQFTIERTDLVRIVRTDTVTPTVVVSPTLDTTFTRVWMPGSYQGQVHNIRGWSDVGCEFGWGKAQRPVCNAMTASEEFGRQLPQGGKNVEFIVNGENFTKSRFTTSGEGLATETTEIDGNKATLNIKGARLVQSQVWNKTYGWTEMSDMCEGAYGVAPKVVCVATTTSIPAGMSVADWMQDGPVEFSTGVRFEGEVGAPSYGPSTEVITPTNPIFLPMIAGRGHKYQNQVVYGNTSTGFVDGGTTTLPFSEIDAGLEYKVEVRELVNGEVSSAPACTASWVQSKMESSACLEGDPYACFIADMRDDNEDWLNSGVFKQTNARSHVQESVADIVDGETAYITGLNTGMESAIFYFDYLDPVGGPSYQLVDRDLFVIGEGQNEIVVKTGNLGHQVHGEEAEEVFIQITRGGAITTYKWSDDNVRNGFLQIDLPDFNGNGTAAKLLIRAIHYERDDGKLDEAFGAALIEGMKRVDFISAQQKWGDREGSAAGKIVVVPWKNTILDGLFGTFAEWANNRVVADITPYVVSRGTAGDGQVGAASVADTNHIVELFNR